MRPGIPSPGGTILGANDDTYFGSLIGGVRTLSSTSNLGTGNITVQKDSRLLLSAATNLTADQYIDVRSNNGGYAVLGIAGNGDNAIIGSNQSGPAYNFRAGDRRRARSATIW